MAKRKALKKRSKIIRICNKSLKELLLIEAKTKAEEIKFKNES